MVGVGDSIVLTRQCAAPTAAPAAGQSGKAQTSGGSSHRHSSQSRGSDGRNAGHSADTSGSALISLAAAGIKIIAFTGNINSNTMVMLCGPIALS